MGERIGTAAVVLAAIAVLGPAFNGGAAGAEGPTAEEPAACDLPVGDIDADDLHGALVILVDGTISSETQEGRVVELVDLLDTATAEQRLSVSVGSFGGSDAEVRFSGCLDGTAFVPQGNNDRTRERNRPELLEAAAAELAALESGYDTTDPTAALRAGVARLEGSRGARVLVIHTDGIPTAGCAALPEEVNVSDEGLVERLSQACADDGRLPSADGAEIVIGGIGRTDEDLSADAVTFLLELNMALCEATGATCRVDPNLPPDL
jgi:hypothetical protein